MTPQEESNTLSTSPPKWLRIKKINPTHAAANTPVISAKCPADIRSKPAARNVGSLAPGINRQMIKANKPYRRNHTSLRSSFCDTL
jgi:hypothetical protein